MLPVVAPVVVAQVRYRQALIVEAVRGQKRHAIRNGTKSLGFQIVLDRVCKVVLEAQSIALHRLDKTRRQM